MTTTQAHTIEDLFTTELAEYARTLQAAGFTIYGQSSPQLRADGKPVPLTFFHYSREVEDVTCYGTVQNHGGLFDGAQHTMPIKPSTRNGSAMLISSRTAPLTVEAAEEIARPSNSGPYLDPAGVVLKNATPWGIGTHYVALEA